MGIIKDICQMWKYRHCWDDMIELWDHLSDIKRIIRELSMGGIWPSNDINNLVASGTECWEWLQYTGTLRVVRPWDVHPPEAPRMP